MKLQLDSGAAAESHPRALPYCQPAFFSRPTAPSKMIKIALGSALASLAAAAPIQKDAPIVSGDGELLPPSGARLPAF